MSIEQNKALAQRFYDEVWSKGNMASLDELIASDIIDHIILPTGPIPPGREGLRSVITAFRSAFPDLTFTPEDMIAEDNKVVIRLDTTGTDSGSGFAGMPPSGRHATVPGIDILRFANGQIVEHWGAADFLGLLTQLGMIPAPGR